jgi:hypothetical protein
LRFVPPPASRRISSRFPFLLFVTSITRLPSAAAMCVPVQIE